MATPEETFYLLDYPELDQISEQLRARSEGDIDGSYGTYTGMPMDKPRLLDDPDQALPEILISPNKVEIGKAIGSFILKGETPDSREAVVIINPFASSDHKGVLTLF